MKIGTKAVLIGLFMAMAGSVHAGSVRLVTITSDSKDEAGRYAYFVLETDEKHDVVAFRHIQYEKKGERANPAVDEVIINDRFALNGNDIGRRIVLTQKKGHVISAIKIKSFEHHNGGVVVIDYLNSGVSGARGASEITIKRTGDNWSITKKGQLVTWMYFKVKRKFALGEVGIEGISFYNGNKEINLD